MTDVFTEKRLLEVSVFLEKTYFVQTSSGNKYSAQYKQMQPSKDYNKFKQEQGNKGLYLNQGEAAGDSI